MRDGRPVPLSAPHRRLLAFLALHPGPHERDALAARFWPDCRDPRANLRTAVWVLRQVARARRGVATRTTVALGPVIARPRRHRPRTGELLRAGSTTTGPRPRAPSTCAAGSPGSTPSRRHADDPADGRRAGRPAAARSTPLDEPAHRALIERWPRRATAPARSSSAATSPAGCAPSWASRPAPATRALLARLRGPAAAPAAAPAGRRARCSAARPSWPRSPRRGPRRATAAGRVVLVTGEAGIGKTRLVAELARRADNAGARVAVGAGVDVGGEAPLASGRSSPARSWGSSRRRRSRPSWPAELGRLAPDLAGALGRHAPRRRSSRRRSWSGCGCSTPCCGWSSGRRRGVRCCSSPRTCTAPTGRASRCARTSAGGWRPCRCCSCSPGATARPVRTPTRCSPTSPAAASTSPRSSCGPLRRAEVAEVARSVAALPDASVAQVVAAADGNPLLAVESARALAAGSTAPPPSLRAAVRAALGALPDPARRARRGGRGGRPRALRRRDRRACRPTRRGGAPRARHRARPPRAAAAWRTGTPCSPRPRAPTCATRRAPTWPSRSPSRRPPQDGDAPRRRGRAAPAAGGPRRPGGAPLAAGRPARPLARRAARGRRVLDRGAALRPGRRRGCAWSSPRCTPGPAGPRTSSASGRPRWPGSHRPSRPRPGAAAGCSSRPSPATRPPRFAAYRRAEELLTRDAPAALRAEVLIGLAWTEASAGDPARSDPLLAEAAALVPDPDDVTVAEIENARLIATIRLGRFAECEAVAQRAGIGDRARAAARLRLRRLDHRGVRAGLRRRPRRRAAHRRPGRRGHPRRAGGGAALPGRAGAPAGPARPPRRGRRHRQRSCSLRPSGSTRRLCSPWPATTPGSSPSPRAAAARRPSCSSPRWTARPR